MAKKENTPPQRAKLTDVTKLKHASDLCKVEDIIQRITYSAELDAYRLTGNPLEEKDVVPLIYTLEESDAPTQEQLQELEEEQREKFATKRAVSMFTTEEKAQKHAFRIVQRYLKRGLAEDAETFKQEHAYITRFHITEEDGVVTKPHRTTKHFNFFPYEDVDVTGLKDETYEPKSIDYDSE